MKYLGYSCPVCQKPFEANDDVVVCPICGAPHHRECYRELGGCALEKNHADGILWEQTATSSFEGQGGDNRQEEPPHDENVGGYRRTHDRPSQPQKCPGCGSPNPPDGVFCQVCGTMMGRHSSPPGGHHPRYSQGGYGQYQQQQTQQPPHGYYTPPAYSPYAGLNPEDAMGEVTVKEVATYVGSAAPHYLPRFNATTRGGLFSSFCWSGFLFSFLFFFYRKVYRVAIPLLILFLLSMVPTFVYSYEYMREIMAQYGSISFPLPIITTQALDNMYIVMNAVRMLQFGVSAALGFWGHRIYLWDVNSKILELRSSMGENPHTSNYIQELSRRGGTSPAGVAVVVAVLTVGYFAVSFLIGVSLNITM